MRRPRPLPTAVLVMALVLLLGFGSVLAAGRVWWDQVMGPGDPRPLVAASTTILADLAAQIGGPRVRVHSLLAPGQDPHSYEPVPRDALALARAQVVLLNGYGIDLWAERLLQGLPEPVTPSGSPTPAAIPTVSPPIGSPQPPPRAAAATPQAKGAPGGSALWRAGEPRRGQAGPLVVRVAEGLPAGVALPWPGDPTKVDPHLWMDPVLVMGYVDAIRDALTAADPAGAAFYRQRAAALQAALRRLDAWIARQVAAVPPERRLLVTTHDAYRYFGRRYGLRVVDTVWGVSTEEEPAAADLARLMGHLRQYGVPAFVESTINPKLMEELAAQAGVPIGGRLYADSVGPRGSGAETYLGMMRHNVRVITEALRTPRPSPVGDAGRP
ncbi:zinc ABC transporter solute-binding protein [Thermaerobacter sp. PB12/4term]|uniref:metal ABC transporter solute-binding protein, Zn/Mn family n=1 Tax=Thermaerobacter sp. PB12/4term TaxID=2293838 RepID=UPI000E32684F|nr:zinc ABC transporter substrate-binding protein [Thermaerobacter sp. PB12/4term]QIA27754.1 zinc ABC transporter solute-binding protein [Thermaerobacter sp. PB12/4term]